MKIVNDHVMISPIVFEHEKNTNPIKGFAMSDKLSNTLVSSVALADSNKFKKGQVLFFKSDIANAIQIRQVFKFKNQEFLLMPETLVVAVEEL